MNVLANKGRWICLALTGLIGLVVVLLAGVLLYVNSERGQRQIRAFAIEALHGAGIEASIGELSGPLPGMLRLREVRLSDAKGVWLEVSEAFLELRLRDVLRGQVTVEELAIVSPVMSRLPEFPTAALPEQPDASTGFMPRLPVALRVDNARIENARIDAAVVGIPIEANLKATASLIDARFGGNISGAGTVAGTKISLEIDAEADRLDAVVPVFRVETKGNAEDGVVHLSAFAAADPAEKAYSGSLRLDVAQLKTLLKSLADKPELEPFLTELPPALFETSGALELEISFEPAVNTSPEPVAEQVEEKTFAGKMRVHLGETAWGLPELERLFGKKADLVLEGEATFAPDRNFPAVTLTTLKLESGGSLAASGVFKGIPVKDSPADRADLQAELSVKLGLAALGDPLSGDVELKTQTRGMVAFEALSGLGDTKSLARFLSGLTSEVTLASPRVSYGTGAQAVILDGVRIRLTEEANQTTKDPSDIRGLFETTITRITGGGDSLGDKVDAGLRLSTIWEASPQSIAMHDTRCDAAGLELKADLKGDFSSLPIKGNTQKQGDFFADLPHLKGLVELSVRNWKTLSALTGTVIKGEPAHIRIETRFDKTQQADLNWNFGSVQAGGIALQGGSGKGRLRAPATISKGSPFNPILELAATLGGGQVSDFVWTEASLNASGPLDTLKLGANLQGPTSAQMEVQLDLTRKTLALTTLEVSTSASALRANANPAEKTVTTEAKSEQKKKNAGRRALGFRLREPVTVGYADGVRVDHLALTLLPAGELTAAGSLNSNKLSFRARLQDLPLRLARIFFSGPFPAGKVNASLEVNGSPARPVGTLSFVASDIAFPQGDMPPFEVRIEGQLGSSLALKGQVSGLSGTPALLELTLPVRFAGGIPEVPMNRPIRGGVNWNGPLAPVWQFVPLANTNLTGNAILEASLSGTLADPRGRMSLRVEKAMFEDILLGILLTDINADMVLNPFEPGLSRVSLSASDGQGGSLHFNGNIGSLADGLPLDIRGELKKLSPLHRNDLSMTISGNAAVTGNAMSPLVAANLTIQKGQFQIVRSFGTSIPTLDVVDVSTLATAPVATSAPIDGSENTPQSGPQLQVSVTIPNQFFVRGSGFESEWKGNLKISGAVASPVIMGQLASVRGQFALLGKLFILKTGQIEFSGATPPNPLLHVVVSYAGPNITAEATVGGTALAPALTLSSQPPMPQDEVMAQVLFGKSASELGRVEALQLAAELASLTTFGRGGGLLNETRSALGLDVLRFGSVQKYQQQNSQPSPLGSLGQNTSQNADTGQSIPTLELGKYVFDNVYVGLEQGMNGDTGGVRVEIELAPHLNLEGRTTPEGSEVGVNWKKDY